MLCAPNVMDFKPDAQTLLTFVHGVPIGNPAFRAAYLAGDYSGLYELILPIPNLLIVHFLK